MKHIYIIALFISVFAITARGQQKENIGNEAAMKAKIFSADSASYNLYQYAQKSPFYLQFMPQQYSQIKGGYDLENGDWKPAQGAKKIQNSYLGTEGSTMLKSVRLWGSFNLNKIYEDSTMYNHQTRNNPSVPFYFGSPINVKYERTVYTLKAMGEKELLKNNLPFGLGVDYRIGSHFSTNDPRGSIKDYQFNMVGTLGYKLFNQLKIGVAYRYGYGEERFAVNYKNTSYTQTDLKPEYNNYLINGYGEAWESKKVLKYNNNENRYGFDAYANYSSAQSGNLMLAYAHMNEKQEFDFKDGKGIINYGHYNITDDKFDLAWNKNFDKKQLLVMLNYQNKEGKDFNYVFEQNNYLYNGNQIALRTVLTVQQDKNQYNYHISAVKMGEERQDGITGNQVAYNQLNLSAGFGYNKTTVTQHNWGIDLKGMYSNSFDNKLNVSEAASGKFTNMVILYDYLYNTAATLGGSLNGDYSFPAFKGVQAGIKLGITYINSLKVKSLDRAIPNLPGKDRFYTNASLNFYF